MVCGPNPSCNPFLYLGLLEHSHTRVFTYCLRCFCATTAESSSCDGDSMVQKTKNIYYLALHKKKSTNAWPRKWIS